MLRKAASPARRLVDCQATGRSLKVSHCPSADKPTRFPHFNPCGSYIFSVCRNSALATCSLLPVLRNPLYAMTAAYVEAALLSRRSIKAATEAFTVLKRFCVEYTCHMPARETDTCAAQTSAHHRYQCSHTHTDGGDQFTVMERLDGSL